VRAQETCMQKERRTQSCFRARSGERTEKYKKERKNENNMPVGPHRVQSATSREKRPPPPCVTSIIRMFMTSQLHVSEQGSINFSLSSSRIVPMSGRQAGIN
jgi:hypothetical protein